MAAHPCCLICAGNDLLAKFCTDLEASIVESIEAGFYTKVRAHFVLTTAALRACSS